MTAPEPQQRRSAFATPEQLAEWLQVTPAWLSKRRKTKTGPKYVKVGRTIRYAWADVHTWCAANRIQPEGGTR